MLFTRERLEHCENMSLAPYGFRSRDSRGRAFQKEEALYRTCFQHDRDRILHKHGAPSTRSQAVRATDRRRRKAERIITALFEAYVEEPRQLPYEEQPKLAYRSLHRVVCDYIAGMTDRFALQEYAKLFDPLEQV